MNRENILRMLGLAYRAGSLEAGEEPVGAAARAKQAKLLLLAGDAADNTARRAAHFAEAGNALCLGIPFSKAELGSAIGRTSCAMLALTDVGFAAAIVKKLAADDPEHFAEAAQGMDLRARRAEDRRAEKRAHEKNVKSGKTAHRSSRKPAAEKDDTKAPAARPARRAGGKPAKRTEKRDGKPAVREKAARKRFSKPHPHSGTGSGT